MDGSSTIDSNTGSDGIFTGSFGAVDYAEYILNTYDDVVMEALKDHAKAQQRSLRKMARASETQWRDIAKHISVKYRHNERNFVYSVKGKKNQELAMNLEYGNGGTPPNPMLRSAAIQSQFDAEYGINNRMGNEFMKGF